MGTKANRLGMAFLLGLGFLLSAWLGLTIFQPPRISLAQGPMIRYIAPPPDGNDSGNDCTNSSTPCATVQHGVDVANPGDEIRVAAGVYTGVQTRPRQDIETTGVVSQVVYISQTLTIRGGYTTTNWMVANPEANPTTLDAQNQGRVIYITGSISPTLEGLQITGGYAREQGVAEDGGGLYIFSATIAIRNSQVYSNNAFVGGGLHVINSPSVQLNDNLIYENGHDVLGGGLYFSQSSNVVLVANIIRENTALEGGGLYFKNSFGTRIEGNIFTGNRAFGSSDNDGGGAYCDSSNTIALFQNIFDGNQADNKGAGMFFKGCDNINVTENTFVNHLACCGGG